MNKIITADYYEGQGCTCYATSANECGCEGADWTPTEVYKLREDAKQLALERDEAIELLKYSSKYSTTKSQQDTYKFLRKIGKLEDTK